MSLAGVVVRVLVPIVHDQPHAGKHHDLRFKSFSEAAEKAADSMDGLTIGGDKDGAQGEGT